MNEPTTEKAADRKPWHHLTFEQAAQDLATDPRTGLADAEAQARLGQHGPNQLQERAGRSPWAIVWDQLTGILVVILIVAAVVSAGIGWYEIVHTDGHEGWGEVYDAIAIGVIVILNTILGFSQEYRAERAMAALKRMSVPTVRVKRGGIVLEIPSTRLVPGDVVLLEAGGLVPADVRLTESANLRIQEAALTGESDAVEKSTAPVAADAALGDRLCMAYMGTVITYGRGSALVTATGMNTQLGHIAATIQSVGSEPTPLQRRLEQLGRGLAVAALVLVTIIFVQGLIRGGFTLQNGKEMFLIAVAMAVAAVPEGLPAVVTISLSLGSQRMFRRKALIRKLLAVETLGSVTVICSDKTGTLTENRMTVKVVAVSGERLDLHEHLTRMRAGGEPEAGRGLLQDRPGVAMALTVGALCNDAVLQTQEGGPQKFVAVGDPTEGALVVAAAETGLRRGDLEAMMPRVWEVPFDSGRKRMTTVHRLPDDLASLGPVLAPLLGPSSLMRPGEYVAMVKGALDGLLDISTHLWSVEGIAPLDADARRRVLSAAEGLSGEGVRVLGMAIKPVAADSPADASVESGLILVGFIGLLDPPRAEVKAAVATCRRAGIRPVMITGDHPLTAWAIAKELGIADGGRMLTGRELDGMSVEDLARAVDEVSVYARVSPEHKLSIVQALRDKGHVVAMTGDGVNDAPALKKSDIGVAMGITGTDVSKEASDVVLLDDNFATIVAAVEEGRVIYDNIRKFIRYLLATNSGEVWVMFLAPLLGMPLPLVPLQILWINLVTDGLPALALGVEPPERDVMRRPPHDPRRSIFADGLGIQVVWVGLLMATVSLAGAAWYWYGVSEPADYHIRHFRTIAFTIVTLTQMANVLAIRTGNISLFRAGLFSNKALVGAVLLTVGLHVVILYVPPMQRLFQTVPLSAADLAIAAGLSSIIFFAVEIEKLIRRRLAGRPEPSA